MELKCHRASHKKIQVRVRLQFTLCASSRESNSLSNIAVDPKITAFTARSNGSCSSSKNNSLSKIAVFRASSRNSNLSVTFYICVTKLATRLLHEAYGSCSSSESNS